MSAGTVALDVRFLSRWIQEGHLADHTVAGYRESFVSHPARVVHLRDFLLPEVAGKLSRFLSDEAEFRVEHGVYSAEEAVSEDAWGRADEEDRFFRLGKLVGTAPEFQLSPNALTYVRFRQAFQRDEMKAYFEAVSGLSLGWSDDFGAHRMGVGDYLRPHSDDNRNRRLALVLYLSPGWEPAFGGSLHVVDGEGTEHVIHPEYNSIVAFDTLAGTTHFIPPIEEPAGDRTRLTIGGWYHNRDLHRPL